MAAPFGSQQAFCVSVDLAAADSSKILVAAPGAGRRLVILRYYATSVTSAAQAVTVKDTTGVLVDRIAISWAVNLYKYFTMLAGIKLTVNEALTATPAAAGPAILFVVEGFIETVST